MGRTSDSMTVPIEDLAINEMVGALCFGCCQAHQIVWLRYSVLFTVESLFLLYLFFIDPHLN